MVGDLPADGGEISIDRDGRWRHEGVEITHPGTVALFFRSLYPDNAGGYVLRVGREQSPVSVEDTPFLVRSIRPTETGFELMLSDGTTEPLDPETLSTRADNAFACRVKNGVFPARFARPAHYMLAEFVEMDGSGAYFLQSPSRKFALHFK